MEAGGVSLGTYKSLSYPRVPFVTAVLPEPAAAAGDGGEVGRYDRHRSPQRAGG